MPFNLRHFGVYSMKKSFLDYERFNAQRAKFNHQISLHTPVFSDSSKKKIVYQIISHCAFCFGHFFQEVLKI